MAPFMDVNIQTKYIKMHIHTKQASITSNYTLRLKAQCLFKNPTVF